MNTGSLMSDIFYIFILVLCTLVSTYLLPSIKTWISTRVDDSKLETLYKAIVKGVKSAEQLYTAEDWEWKKKYVMNYAENIIESLIHIDLTEEQLDTIVEAIVHEVKHENKD